MTDKNRQILFNAAMSNDPPLLTDDVIVNHMVDVYMEDSSVPYDVNIYMEEIEAWKRSGGFLLSYHNNVERGR